MTTTSPKRPPGRPRGEPTAVVSARLPIDLAAKFWTIGGAEWLRKAVARARTPTA